MHDDDRHAALGDQMRAMSASRCRPHTSLTIAAPWSSAHSATCALMVSIDTGRPNAAMAGRIGSDALQLFLRRDGPCAAIGAGRFRADVEDVGALVDHAAGMGDRDLQDSWNSPPSENESGVTLRMPITTGRPDASSRSSGWDGAEMSDVMCRARLMVIDVRGRRKGVKASMDGPPQPSKSAFASS